MISSDSQNISKHSQDTEEQENGSANVGVPKNDIEQRIKKLERLMAFHKHLGSDLTQKITTGSTAYSGLVTSAGAASTPFPTGWTVIKNSTGNYTVTHNLGNTNYGVCVTVSDGVVNFLITNNRTSTTFDVLTYNSSFSSNDRSFYFIVV